MSTATQTKNRGQTLAGGPAVPLGAGLELDSPWLSCRSKMSDVSWFAMLDVDPTGVVVTDGGLLEEAVELEKLLRG